MTPTRDELVALYTSVGWDRYTADPDRLLRVVEASDWVDTVRVDGALVALCRALSDGGTILYVQDVLVHPAHHRQGHGRRLLEACFAAHPDVRQIVLLTDDRPVQHAFYRALGLTDTRELPVHAFVRFR